jgi:hypothetical protein
LSRERVRVRAVATYDVVLLRLIDDDQTERILVWRGSVSSRDFQPCEPGHVNNEDQIRTD